MTGKPTRPILRYHGGKWRLAPWIISHFPPHRIYVEPYGGAASVLLRKERSFAEVYNDLDGEIVNVFRVMRDRKQAEELIRLLELTPYAREEFDLSYEKCEDPVEQARRTVVRSFMGLSSCSVTRKHKAGFRSNIKQHNTARDWPNHAEFLPVLIERLRGVVIENKPAIDILGRYEDEETLFISIHLMSQRHDILKKHAVSTITR